MRQRENMHIEFSGFECMCVCIGVSESVSSHARVYVCVCVRMHVNALAVKSCLQVHVPISKLVWSVFPLLPPPLPPSLPPLPLLLGLREAGR